MTDRLAQFIEYLGISIRAFEQQITASNGLIKKAIAKKMDVQSKWITAIVDNYPQLDIEWLLTGQGVMLKDSVTTISSDIVVNEPSSDLVSYMKALIKDKDAEIVRLSNENALLKSDLEKYESKKNASTKDYKRSTQAPIEPKLK